MENGKLRMENERIAMQFFIKDDMVTYSDLFQFGILIVAIISLCLKHRK